MPINNSTVLFLFGGIERLYVFFDKKIQDDFLVRFQTTLQHMLEDLRNNYTMNEVINFYSTVDIIQDLALQQRYNFNISVSEIDIAKDEVESRKQKDEN